MSELKIEHTVLMKGHRCHDCGRWSAVEQDQLWGCIICKQRTVDRLYAELDEAKRSAAALRGAITRVRRRG